MFNLPFFSFIKGYYGKSIEMKVFLLPIKTDLKHQKPCYVMRRAHWENLREFESRFVSFQPVCLTELGNNAVSKLN